MNNEARTNFKLGSQTSETLANCKLASSHIQIVLGPNEGGCLRHVRKYQRRKRENGDTGYENTSCMYVS